MAINQKSEFRYKPHVLYAVLVLTILSPLLLPGYIFTLDLVFAPRIPLHSAITSDYMLRALLHLLNIIVPSSVLEKLLVFITFWLMGIGAYWLASYITERRERVETYERWGAYLAGAFYMINPYTYSRFMAGHYLVLLGYGVLPFFVKALLRFLEQPGWRSVLKLACWVILISIVSIHTLGLVAVLTVVALGLSAWRYRGQQAYLRRMVSYGLLGLFIFLVASSYWLVPLMLGKGEIAQTVAQFGKGDQQAFATIGQGVIGQLSNVIRLQGFWAEGSKGGYALPQDRMPAWGLMMLIVWVLVVVGGRALWRKGRRFETALFGSSAGIAVVLSVGGTSNWLSHVLPLFGGFREPHKFVGLVALMYAVFVGQGTAQLMRKAQKRFHEMGAYGVLAIIMVVLVACTPTMFWGFGGQLRPRQYPDDWYAINKRLDRDKSDFQVVFLPWHLYMYFDFAGRIIANPAENFFDKPVIVSNNPEFGKASLTDKDPTKLTLSRTILAQAKQGNNLGSKLAPLHVKYLILAKEDDYQKYTYLDHQKDLQLISESDTIKLYRNVAWGD